MRRLGFALLALAGALAAPRAAWAQSADADFFRGKTIQIYVGLSIGGSYDLYARALARHIGSHIPGDPTVVVVNMPGAGGLIAANYVYRVAPKDGTALAMTAQTLPTDQLFGVSGVQYDAHNFIWIGRVASSQTNYFTWHTSPTKTFDDATKRVTTLGSSGSGDTTNTPYALDHLAGAKFKLVLGYRGSSDVLLAVERGEVEGGYGLWADFKFRKADWLRNGLVNNIFLMADKRDPKYPDMPTAEELGPTAEARAILHLFSAPGVIGRSLLTAPKVPPGRVAILRRAFDDTIADPAFIADAKKIGMDVDPMTGAELQKEVADLMETPPDLIAKADAARQP